MEILQPDASDSADLLKKVIGPSGNLRAPTLKVGERYLVGFNPDLYQQELL